MKEFKEKEIKYKNLGVKVELKHKRFPKKIILRNVTEIHHNFKSCVFILGYQTAFESDIHSTGLTYPTNDIKILKITKEKKKAKSF